jgi:hypothetical protein
MYGSKFTKGYQGRGFRPLPASQRPNGSWQPARDNREASATLRGSRHASMH